MGFPVLYYVLLFVFVYLTTLSKTQFIRPRVTKFLVNKELDYTWIKAVMA
jgi:hypothetical protein